MTRVGDEKPCTYKDCEGTMTVRGLDTAAGFGPAVGPPVARWQCKKNPSHVEPRPETTQT